MATQTDGIHLPNTQIHDNDGPRPPDEKSPASSSRDVTASMLPWSVETVAAFFALSSFSVLVVVLKHYDGISPTAWPFGALTLNGLVAILSAITRAALLALVSASLSQGKWINYVGSRQRRLMELELYDQASRSIWGSLQYLCRIRRIQLASVGAILTILALAFDTFAQQVISFETHSVVINATAQSPPPNVPRTEIYTGVEDSPGSTNANPGLSMEAAWHAGLLTFNTTGPQPYCATGNCTWPVVSSLAVCGECTDVSSDLTLTRLGTSPYFFNISLPGKNKLINDSPHEEERLLSAESVDSSRSNAHYQAIDYDKQAGYFLLSHFDVISLRDKSQRATSMGLNETAAYECALWFCIQAYNISMTNGQLNQTVVGQWSQSDPRSMTENMDTYYTVLNFTTPPPEFNIPDGTTWAVSSNALHGVQSYTNSFFPMEITNRRIGGYETSYANGIWANIGNMDHYIDSFASTMTNALRINSITSPIGDVHYQGTAFKDETRIRVRWGWLAFPAAMLVGSCLLLLITVWRTERSLVGAWKASTLALLFIRMGDGLQEAASGRMTQEGESLDKVVGKERVRLSPVDGMWRLD